jgi:uncharacterized protein YndB with AHSA1/START domain
MHTPRESITVDPRPGGVFRLTMVSDIDGSEYPSDVTSRQVVPIELLVYGWEAQGRGIGGGEVTVTFSEENGQTLLVQRFVGDISKDMLPMMEQGTNEQLDKLGSLLATA